MQQQLRTLRSAWINNPSQATADVYKLELSRWGMGLVRVRKILTLVDYTEFEEEFLDFFGSMGGQEGEDYYFVDQAFAYQEMLLHENGRILWPEKPETSIHSGRSEKYWAERYKERFGEWQTKNRTLADLGINTNTRVEQLILVEAIIVEIKDSGPPALPELPIPKMYSKRTIEYIREQRRNRPGQFN